MLKTKDVVTKLEDVEEVLDDRDSPKQMKKTPLMKKKESEIEKVKAIKAENPCDVKMVWQYPLLEETIPKAGPKAIRNF